MQTTSAPMHCSYSAKAVPMNGAPSSNADKAAFRRSARKCAGPITAKNRTSCGKSIRTQIFIDTVKANFLHEVQFSAAIEAAHFPAVETGHWPAVSCHFHLLINRLLGQTGYSAKLFSTSKIEVFFSSVVLAHRMMCAAQGCMQMGRLAYTDADNTMQHRA